MMNYILFDDQASISLLPFTFTRPVSAIRAGILTIAEKWQMHLGATVSYFTSDYLTGKYQKKIGEDNLLINGSLIPDEDLLAAISKLKSGQELIKDKKLLAARVTADGVNKYNFPLAALNTGSVIYDKPVVSIENPWEIFIRNDQLIRIDYKRLTRDKKSAPISKTNTLLGEENIFLEPGAKVECSIINASAGPVYIGKNAEVMEGCMIRGPFALCDNAVLKMGAKVYGATTIGPYSKAGGEISNSVILGCSNKAHDGFLGNSVIGEWCNLGADTNNSNLKNNYGDVKIWSYGLKNYIDTGLQFCGLFMGDHSKSGINTMFNTGTVVGVSANIFGGGFPGKYIPSFCWGGVNEMYDFRIEKAIELATEVFKRRGFIFDENETAILHHLYQNKTSYMMP
jgi:UDP-N-acetylglucosamine diphosphorylase/glucosamine-1-phosphate N-acetyltransferase